MSETVRSGRRGNFFIIENALIDDYLEKIGGAGIAVYCILSKYSDRAGSTFVGLERMGKLSGLAKSTISKALAALVDNGLIKVVKTETPVAKTTYWVLPVPPLKPTTETPLFESVDDSKEEALAEEGSRLFAHEADRVGVRPIPSNKEEQDPSTNKTQESNKTPTAEAGEVVNPFSHIISIIDREYALVNDGDKCPWQNKRAFKALGDLLQRYKNWPLEKWETCVVNRYASLGFMSARAEPWEFIPRLYLFADGPVNQFGKPIEQTGGSRRGNSGRVDFKERITEELRIARDLSSGNGGSDAE